MGKALYCPFPTCKTEYYTYCPMHQALMPCILAVIEHHDPEGILSQSVNISNLQPMIKVLEEQYRDNKRLERELRHYETEIARLQGGR
jgi:AmiR/NasT family two-component response regulator